MRMGIGGAEASETRDDEGEAGRGGHQGTSARPVFVDSTGRRNRTWRRAGTVATLCCACYATTVAVALVGGDSSAPFLQLPRAMAAERQPETQPSAGSTPGTPGSSAPAFPAQPSGAAPSSVRLPLAPSSGATHTPTGPTAPPSGARTSAPTSGETELTGADDEAAETAPAKEPATPAPGPHGRLRIRTSGGPR